MANRIRHPGARFGGAARDPRAGAVPSAGAAIHYVRASVPDAVKKFGLDDKRILDLVLPKITAARLARSAERPAPDIESVG